MGLKFKSAYLIGIIFGLVIIFFDILLYFYYEPLRRWFVPIIILAISLGGIQFWIDLYRDNKRQKEIEVKFLEFAR